MKNLLFFGTNTSSYFYIENIYFEDDTGTSQGTREIVFKEHQFLFVSIAYAPIFNPVVDKHPVAPDVDLVALTVVMDIPLRRSERESRPIISDDYIVYLQEHEYDVGDVSDLTTYKETIVSPQSNFWIDAMKDEMTSM